LLKREKEVLQHRLKSEKAVIKELETQYKAALEQIEEKIILLQARPDSQSKAYQMEFQKALKKQVQGILDKLQSDEFFTIDQYLNKCYTDAFVGTVYSLHAQNMPLILPIDQNAVVKAITTDTMLKEELYEELGIDVAKLKKTISSSITRGIASGLTFTDIAEQIHNAARAPMSRAKTIARTEGHRIQEASTYDAYTQAKQKGADIVRQWCAILDGATRPTHRMLDGQIREDGEYFEIGTKKARFPGDFGDAAEDCNCRCTLLNRARAALDEDELKTLKDRAEYFGLDKSESFADFKKKYLKGAETLKNQGENGIIKLRNSTLKNGLPIKGIPNSTVDKTDDDGKTLQRRIYGAEGLAKTDYDTSDHGLPHLHPTYAHKHEYDHTKKKSRSQPLKLTEEELKKNSDIIRKGVNYHDEK